MIHNVLVRMENVGVYPAVSLILFLLVFAAVVIWALTRNRRYVDHMKQMPLNHEPRDGGETRHD